MSCNQVATGNLALIINIKLRYQYWISYIFVNKLDLLCILHSMRVIRLKRFLFFDSDFKSHRRRKKGIVEFWRGRWAAESYENNINIQPVSYKSIENKCRLLNGCSNMVCISNKKIIKWCPFHKKNYIRIWKTVCNLSLIE